MELGLYYINDLFDARDAELIVKLPIASSFDDTWCWRGDVRGVYAVKHGYKMMSSHDASYHGASPDLEKYLEARLKINFLWRCVHGVLPIMVTLAMRRMEVDVTCHLCRHHPESLRHLFFDCEQVQPLWAGMNYPSFAGDDDFVSWFSLWLSHAETDVKLQCAALLPVGVFGKIEMKLFGIIVVGSLPKSK